MLVIGGVTDRLLALALELLGLVIGLVVDPHQRLLGDVMPNGQPTEPKSLLTTFHYPAQGSACGTSPCPSRCLVSARSGSDREPSTRNAVVSGPTRDQTSAQTSGVAGVRAAVAAALAADWPRILRALSALAPHLSGWEHDQVARGVIERHRRPRPEGHPSSLARGTGAPLGNLPRARP